MKQDFSSATQKIQDLMTLYGQLDGLSNRAMWHFEPKYKDRATCAFVFAHTTTDAAKRYEELNLVSDILSRAGIKNSLVASDGLISDVIIAPECADLATKIFSRYHKSGAGITKGYDIALEKEWLSRHQK